MTAHELLPLLAPRLSERPLRLYACALARRCWDMLTDPRSRQAVEVAESFAEGKVTAAALSRHWTYLDIESPHDKGWIYAYVACSEDIARALRESLANPVYADRIAPFAAELLRDVAGPENAPALCGTRAQKLDILNPNPDKCATCRQFLTWNEHAIPRIAQRIADERSEDASLWGALADALAEAGVSDDNEVLKSCRGLRRCDAAECRGRGKWCNSAGDFETCHICSGSGWVPAGGIHAGLGSWVTSLILGAR